MVFNLDKCIGCHTCSVTCKNVWTNRKGVEVRLVQQRRVQAGHRLPEGMGEPGQVEGWLDQAQRQARAQGRRRLKKIVQIFQPEPAADRRLLRALHLRLRPSAERAAVRGLLPTARPVSQITGEKMDKITWGPNWEDDLAGEFASRARDKNFSNMEKEMYKQFENTFHMYLPRICNHCINPACVASCRPARCHKREERRHRARRPDRCRGWRMCISGLPYKKVFNWGRPAEKCVGCYPRVENGMPTVCSSPASAASATTASSCTTPTRSRPRPAPTTSRTCTRSTWTCSSIPSTRP